MAKRLCDKHNCAQNMCYIILSVFHSVFACQTLARTCYLLAQFINIAYWIRRYFVIIIQHACIVMSWWVKLSMTRPIYTMLLQTKLKNSSWDRALLQVFHYFSMDPLGNLDFLSFEFFWTQPPSPIFSDLLIIEIGNHYLLYSL